MLADFVSKRGGGLLMLGGRRVVRRRRLGRHAGRRSAAGRDRAARTPKYLLRALGRGRRAPARTFPVTQIADDEARVEREVERPAGGVDASTPVREVEAGRDGAADRRRQPQAGSDRARVPALRARQGDRDADPGLVALADGREDGGHRHDARDVLAAPGPLAGRRRARPGQPDDDRRSRRAGRAGQAHGRSARPGLRRGERRRVDRAASPRRPGKTDRGAGGVDRRRSDGDYRASFVPDESGHLRRPRHRRRAIRRSSARRRCTCACRPATPSTSTPRCARRC